MNAPLYVSAIILCLLIAFQDFKYRAISWFFFPVLFILIIVIGILRNISCKDYFLYSTLNMAILIGQFLLLKLYFRIKKGRRVSVINQYLGAGDVLFILIFCWAFSSFNFLLIYLLTLVITLIVSVSVTQMRIIATTKIPLAGYFALILTLVLFLELFYTTFNTYDDNLTRQYLYRWIR